MLILQLLLGYGNDLVEKGKLILQERRGEIAAAVTLVWERGWAPGPQCEGLAWMGG